MKRRFFLAAFLLVLSGLLLHSYAQAYLEGHAREERMLNKATRRFEESKVQMKISYNALNQTLDSIGQHKLHVLQKDWEHFRKSSCAFETDYARNQVLEKFLNEDCMVSMNNARATYMDNELKWNYTVDPGMAMVSNKKP